MIAATEVVGRTCLTELSDRHAWRVVVRECRRRVESVIRTWPRLCRCRFLLPHGPLLCRRRDVRFWTPWTVSGSRRLLSDAISRFNVESATPTWSNVQSYLSVLSRGRTVVCSRTSSYFLDASGRLNSPIQVIQFTYSSFYIFSFHVFSFGNFGSLVLLVLLFARTVSLVITGYHITEELYSFLFVNERHYFARDLMTAHVKSIIWTDLTSYRYNARYLIFAFCNDHLGHYW